MRIAYLDCFAGISGDMFLGAVLGAGVPRAVLDDAVAALNLGASLKIETVDRSGISAVKVHVMEGEVLAEGHTHDQAHGAAPQQQAASAVYTEQPLTQHLHKAGHAQTHADARMQAEPERHRETHAHGRSLSSILTLLRAAPLEEAVKSLATHAFELLGESEAKIHNVPVEEIHFHEVGAVDAIVDIVAASAGVHHLQIGAWHCSALNVGGGMVECAHGNFPVPAPATADLLRGMPTYSAYVQKELVTPTGAALVRVLRPSFGKQPAMKVEQIGYGAGTRNPQGFPNVLRLSIGSSTREEAGAHDDSESVTVLETALDDLSPQVLAHVAETAMARGALDVMLTPVIMKKGRPGTLLTILCHDAETGALQQLILCETSTLGVRIRRDRRVCLERSHTSVATPFGEIRMKVGTLEGRELNAAPEFEDCRRAALEHKVAVKQVQQAAIAAYHR